MDQASFDGIARRLATTGSRRSALKGALAAIVSAAPGLGGSVEASSRGSKDGAATKTGANPSRSRGGKHDRPGSAPAPSGPCGSGAANTCKRNADCCTKICDKKTKRCVCIPIGKACTPRQGCCGDAVCTFGVCTRPGTPVATGKRCNAGDTCEDPDAVCIPYKTGNPAALYCLRLAGATCRRASECNWEDCQGGKCQQCACGSCPACSPIVCASGCPHATVQSALDAALAGDVIDIGPGTYTEDVVVRNPVVLRACQPGTVTIVNATYRKRAIEVRRGVELSIENIDVSGYNDKANSKWGGGIGTYGSLALCGGTTVKDGAWYNGGGVWVVMVNDPDVDTMVTITDDVIIENNHARMFGGGMNVYGAIALTIDGNAKIRNNTCDSYGGGMAMGDGVTVVIEGNATVEGNTASVGQWASGGGIIFQNDLPSSLIVRGNAAVKNNQSKYGAGIYAGNGGTPDPADGASFVESGEQAVVSGNAATYLGGGIYSGRVPVTLSGSASVTANSATDPTADGGGITVSGYLNSWAAGVVGLTMRDSASITANTAGDSGGGVNLYMSGGTLSDSATVSGNTAKYGGGFLLTADANVPSPLTLTGSASVTGNTATGGTGSGGGIWSNSVNNTVTGGAAVTGNTPDDCVGTTC